MAAIPPLERPDPPASPDDKGTMLKLRATLYMIALESDFPAGEDASFLTSDGTVLHKTSKAFLSAAALQGTAQLSDGRILMIDGRRKGPPRWKISPHGYAVGFSGCKLVPFRSVAVDRRIVPMGSQLHIEATRGMKLPDGKLHDGVWYAVDTGGRIRNNRVDLFVGAGKTPLSVPIDHGIKHLQPLEVRVGDKMQDCPTALSAARDQPPRPG
jgi:3D (Asp-Asp-Asp) domain-containing protein